MAYRSVAGGVFESMYNDVIDNIDYEAIANEMQEFARDGHRSLNGVHYQNQTGTLRAGTYGKYDKKKHRVYVGTDSKSILNTQGNPYDKYVLYGHGTWAGDDFIGETVNRRKGIAKKLFQRELDKSVNVQNSKSSGGLGLLTGVMAVFGGSAKVIRYLRRLFGR